MITFQENTHFSQALPCTREEFWEQVKKPTTRWRIDMRRAILAAVEASKNRDTQFQQGMPYIVKGFWKHRTWGDNNDRHENAFYITDLQTL